MPCQSSHFSCLLSCVLCSLSSLSLTHLLSHSLDVALSLSVLLSLFPPPLSFWTWTKEMRSNCDTSRICFCHEISSANKLVISFKFSLFWFLRTRTEWSQILSQTITQLCLSPFPSRVLSPSKTSGYKSPLPMFLWHYCLPSFQKNGPFLSALCSRASLTQSTNYSTFPLWTSSKGLRTTLPHLWWQTSQ